MSVPADKLTKKRNTPGEAASDLTSTSDSPGPVGKSGGLTSPNVELINLMTIQPKDGGISSKMTINLQPYINSFKEKDMEAHALYKENLSSKVKGLTGETLWEDMLKAATNAASSKGLSPDDTKLIENSPACTYMRRSFVEIVKNVMDEAVLGAYEAGRKAQLELDLNIDMSSPGRIELTVRDNGRGFSSGFLEKTSTPANRDAYIMETSTNKSRNDEDKPALFGGAGLGLRILMAQTEGDMLEGPGKRTTLYEKPAISEIALSNGPNGGAEIRVTTSPAPLQEKAFKATSETEAPIKLGMPPIRKKKTAAAASTTTNDPDVTTKMREAMINLRASAPQKENDKPEPDAPGLKGSR